MAVTFELVLAPFFSRLFYLDDEIRHGRTICVDDDDEHPVIVYANKGRAALVTGSARGLGKAIALELAQDGVDIAIPTLASLLAACPVTYAGKRCAVGRSK